MDWRAIMGRILAILLVGFLGFWIAPFCHIYSIGKAIVKKSELGERIGKGQSALLCLLGLVLPLILFNVDLPTNLATGLSVGLPVGGLVVGSMLYGLLRGAYFGARFGLRALCNLPQLLIAERKEKNAPTRPGSRNSAEIELVDSQTVAAISERLEELNIHHTHDEAQHHILPQFKGTQPPTVPLDVHRDSVLRPSLDTKKPFQHKAQH